MIRFTFDIHTHQPVYAVCDTNGNCLMLTTSIAVAIQKLQTK